MAEDDVNPIDEAKDMWAGIKEKFLALKQKLGKFIAKRSYCVSVERGAGKRELGAGIDVRIINILDFH
jgi:hypothetical protein